MTELSDGLRAIFDAHRDEFQRRLTTLEAAVAAILGGSLDENLRASAQRDAHKLAGSLGTFGLARGSEPAQARTALRGGARARRDRPRAPRRHPPSTRRPPRQRSCHATADPRREANGPTRAALVDVPDIARQLGDDRALRRAMFETGLAGTEPAELASARILADDDDPPVRQAIAAILTDAGYDVRNVGGVAEARHVLAHETIDLLLSDVSMPGETGIDLIASRSASTRTPRRC